MLVLPSTATHHERVSNHSADFRGDCAVTCENKECSVMVEYLFGKISQAVSFYFKYLNFFHNASIIQLLSFSLYGFARLQVILSVLAPF